MLGVEAHSSLPHDQYDGGNLPGQGQPRHFRSHAPGQTRPVIPEIIKYPAATLRIEGNGDRNCPGTVPRRAFYLGVRQAARRPNLRLGRITRQRDLSGYPTNQELTHDKDTSRPVQDFLFWFLVSKEGGDYLRLTVAPARLARAIHYEYRANKK